jgi:hypothetical protein
MLKKNLLFKLLNKLQRKKNCQIKINQNQLKAKKKEKFSKNLKHKTKKNKKSQKLNRIKQSLLKLFQRKK